MGIRLFEAPLSQVVGGLGNDLYDAALAMTGEMDVGWSPGRCGKTRWSWPYLHGTLAGA